MKILKVGVQYERNLSMFFSQEKRTNIQHILYFSQLLEASTTSFVESYFGNHLKTDIVDFISLFGGEHI